MERAVYLEIDACFFQPHIGADKFHDINPCFDIFCGRDADHVLYYMLFQAKRKGVRKVPWKLFCHQKIEIAVRKKRIAGEIFAKERVRKIDLFNPDDLARRGKIRK